MTGFTETSAKMFFFLYYYLPVFDLQDATVFYCPTDFILVTQYTATQVHFVSVCLSVVDIVLYVSTVPSICSADF